MKKTAIARNPDELARLLDLDPADAVEMQVRRQITDKIIDALKHSGLTHAELAKAAHTSRARLTAVLNRNTAHVSTDLLLRILVTLGYRAKITFTRTRRAA